MSADRFENKKFLEKVRKAFLDLAKKYKWKVINTFSSKEEVITKLLEEIF